VADTLFIRLTDDGAASWAALDSLGRLLGPVGHGPLSAARAAVEGRRIAVLVPGVDVISLQAVLPAASQARLRQIVPFSLEDSLADDVDELAFAVGARDAQGKTAVAVAAKQRIDDWIARLKDNGLAPNTLCSEADGVPEVPATLVVMAEGSRIYARRPGAAPFVVDGLGVADVLAMASAEDGDEPTFDRVLVYADREAQSTVHEQLTRIEDGPPVELKIAADGLLPHWATSLVQRPGVSLLQGPYAARSNWIVLARPWRFAAGLAAAALVLALVLQAAQFWQLKRADSALDDLIASACQRAVGDSRLSACQRAVQQRLGASAASQGNEDFLSTLSAVAAVRDAQMRVDGLSYRNRTMDLQLIVANVPALAEFERNLEETRRFDVEIEAANQSDAGTQGRVRIAGATR
jgi:general secretion pathway protein L